MEVSIVEEKVSVDMQEVVNDVLELTVTVLEFPAKLVVEEWHNDLVPSMAYSRNELYKLLRASSLSIWFKSALFHAIWGTKKDQVGRMIAELEDVPEEEKYVLSGELCDFRCYDSQKTWEMTFWFCGRHRTIHCSSSDICGSINAGIKSQRQKEGQRGWRVRQYCRKK
jgi:hypothetical protein